jgi:hypothetical protein
MKPVYPEKSSCTGKKKHKLIDRMSADRRSAYEILGDSRSVDRMLADRRSASTLRFAVAVLMITVFLTGPTSAAVVSGSTHLEVEVSEITPNPARPGEDLLIRTSIQNTGDEPAENVIIGIEEIQPFIFNLNSD